MALKAAKRLKGTEPMWKSTVEAAPVIKQEVKQFEKQTPIEGQKTQYPWPVVAKCDQDPDREYSVVGRDLSTITAEEAKSDRCPACNSKNYHREGGCKRCLDCQWSPCE